VANLGQPPVGLEDGKSSRSEFPDRIDSSHNFVSLSNAGASERVEGFDELIPLLPDPFQSKSLLLQWLSGWHDHRETTPFLHPFVVDRPLLPSSS